jgi:regulation of enolase protein 1 (concanavalin A-like superfamily)
MVVSVVTRGTSDDANGFVVAGGFAWLRISRVGSVFAFHASVDGTFWSFVRAFSLGGGGATARVGFEGQSPVGEGTVARFDDLRFSRRTLVDLRDGS